jgi:uncharacterized protein DUF4267
VRTFATFDAPGVRRLAAALGVATFLFGAAPALAPRSFARLFGLPTGPDPTVGAAIRSVGVRDVALGLGLWSAATRGGDYAPWLLARALADGGDAVAVALAIRAGARRPRFVALGVLALGAGVCDALLHRAARRR